MLFGFVLAAVVGIAVALVIVRFERFGKALYPLVVLFQNVPKVALAPIFILWFGYDLAPKIVADRRDRVSFRSRSTCWRACNRSSRRSSP